MSNFNSNNNILDYWELLELEGLEIQGLKFINPNPIDSAQLHGW